MELEIYLDDLKDEAKEKLLKFMKVTEESFKGRPLLYIREIPQEDARIHSIISILANKKGSDMLQ